MNAGYISCRNTHGDRKGSCRNNVLLYSVRFHSVSVSPPVKFLEPHVITEILQFKAGSVRFETAGCEKPACLHAKWIKNFMNHKY